MAESSTGRAPPDSSAVREAIEDRVSQPNGALISGRYRIEGVLGTGGMGTVYLVQHTHMRKRFALKMLHAETSQVPELVARFEREAVAMSRAEHPNIATATDFGRAENGAFFLVLEYIEGYSLRNALATGPLEATRVVHIARQIAGALERSHDLGIIHRDLKPENIMLVPRQGDADFVKILDFGLAKLAPEAQEQEVEGEGPDRVITRHGSVFGTPRYMAPEQCLGETVDGRSDLYALGLIMYEALTGLHPFDEREPRRMLKHHLFTPIPPMKTRAPSVTVPESLDALVMRMLEKPRGKRPASATEFLTELAAVCEKEGIVITESSARFPVPRMPTSAPGTAPALVPPPRPAADDEMATQDVPGGAATQDISLSASSAAVTQDVSNPSVTQSLPPSDDTAPPQPPQQAVTQPPGSEPTQPPQPIQVDTQPPQPVQADTQPPVGLTERPPGLPALPPLMKRQPLLLPIAAVLIVLLVVLALLRPSKPQAPVSRPVPGPVAASGDRPLPASGPAAATAANTAGAPLSQAQIDHGRAAGAATLLELIKSHPTDARLPQTLATLYISQGNGLEALRWQAKALALNDSGVYDLEIVQAANLALNGAESGEAAVALLEHDFGARGVDVLYALLTRPGPLRGRIARSLTQEEVRGHASPATLIAIDLHNASRCETKRALLPRAAQFGDHRTLNQLKPLTVIRGCGTLKLGDCWPCLRKDAALRNAIASINARASLAH